MRALLPITLIAAIASTAALAGEPVDARGAQKVALGLKAPAPAQSAVWRTEEDTEKLQVRNHGMSYGGVRANPRAGLYSVESYGGIFHPLADNLGSTIEAGVARDAPFALSRYSVTGRVLTTLAPRHGLSLGLKFTTAERYPLSNALSARTDDANDSLTDRWNGANYELQVNYLYGKRHSVGMSYQLGNGHSYSSYELNPNPRAFSLSTQHSLTPNWSMSYDISATEPGALLQSPSVGVGLRYRF